MRHDETHHVPLSSEDERMHASLSDEDLHEAKTTDLARTLADRLLLMAKKEVELARAEAQSEIRRSIFLGGLAGGSAIFFISALVCALVCAILAIGLAWNPIWVALIGFGLFVVLGVAVGLVAAEETRELKPERTIRQARETLSLLREPLST